jgi:probable HAF family extracellular repeat protein
LLIKKKSNTTFTAAFKFPGSDSTRALGINKADQIVGNFIKATQSHSFLAQASPAGTVGSFLQLDFPGSLGTSANGINTAGKIVGAFADRNRREHGFLARPLQAHLPIHVKLSSVFPNQKPLRITFFSTDDFDATAILPDTVRFGVLDIPGPVPSGATPVQVDVEDVNHDDTLDLVLFFDPQDTGLQCSDTTASLIGQLDDGQVFGGAEKVKVKCEQ